MDRVKNWIEIATDTWVRIDDIGAFWNEEGRAVIMAGKEKVLITEWPYQEFLSFMKEEWS